MDLLQSFTVPFSTQNSETGMNLSKVRLFIQKLETSAVVQVSVYTFERGVKGSRPIATVSRYVNALTQTYAQATSGGHTDFTFELNYPITVKQGARYILQVSCPQTIKLFAAKVGEQSLRTGTTITSNVLTDGTSFSVNSTNNSLTAANGEDLMFEIYTRRYQTSGEVNLVPQTRRVVRVKDLTSEPYPGFVIRARGSVTVLGTVVGFDLVSRSVIVQPEGSNWDSAGLVSGNILEFYSFSGSFTITGTAEIESLTTSISYDGFNLGVFQNASDNTYTNFNFTPNASTQTAAYFAQVGKNFFFPSQATYQPSLNNSFRVKARLGTNNPYATPYIIPNASTVFLLSNKTTPLGGDDDEGTDYGTAISKYESKVVTLADGQDAEDLHVYLTAFRPVGTELRVYARLLSTDDEAQFTDKKWTRLTIDPAQAELYSTSGGAETTKFNMREFKYTIPTFNTDLGETLPSLSGDTYPRSGSAFRDIGEALEPGVVRYSTQNSASAAQIVHYRFKKFAVKVVFVSQSSSVVPLVDDIRAIAIQL